MKIRYEIDLDVVHSDQSEILASYEVRPPMRSDAGALAELMLESYRGTIDYTGSGIEEALSEVEGYFNRDPLLAGSSIVATRDQLISACLVARRPEPPPLIGYVMTHPDFKGRGIGRECVVLSLQNLRLAGEHSVELYITEGNVASERLFASLGARAVPDS